MSDEADKLINQLKLFGLTSSEGKIYIYLLNSKNEGALKISRSLKISRTKIYRLLEKLIEKGLVVQNVKKYGTTFEANSSEQILMLLKEKEQELEILKNTAPMLINYLSTVQSGNSGESKVLYYHGLEGLKQVTWNSLKAKGTLRLFEIKDMAEFLDFGFAEKVREEFVKRNVKVKEISNQKSYEGWTNISSFVENNWSCRYMDPEKLEMKFEVLIYNDVYCAYSYEKSEIFCVEIYNQNLANMQKQIFDYMWSNSLNMKILDNHGKSKLLNSASS